MFERVSELLQAVTGGSIFPPALLVTYIPTYVPTYLSFNFSILEYVVGLD